MPLLARHFLHGYAERNHRTLKGFTREALERLMAHPWPGNVRELAKSIERAVVLARGEFIEASDLFEEEASEDLSRKPYAIPYGATLEDIESRVIFETLRRTGGDKKLTAQILGIAARTIYRKMDRIRGETDEREEEGEEDLTP